MLIVALSKLERSRVSAERLLPALGPTAAVLPLSTIAEFPRGPVRETVVFSALTGTRALPVNRTNLVLPDVYRMLKPTPSFLVILMTNVLIRIRVW